jgi:hypothetical protein
MNVITDTLRQLVRRKLWPVALLLIGALVAVPVLLARQPETETLAQAANAKKVEPLPATFVSDATTGEPDATGEVKRRHVLGAVKDPFTPAELPKVKKKKTAKKADEKPTETKSETPPADTGKGGGGAATPPTSAAPTPTPAPTITVPAYSVKVRFGASDAENLSPAIIERLAVLPDEANPVMVYRGQTDHGKAAVFELTGEVQVDGDATCTPTPENCQYIRLRAGETAFVTVSGTVTETGDAADEAQYQLDLVKIYTKKTKEKAPADQATQSLAKASTSSLKTKSLPLRRRNRYVFDAATGLLERARKGAKTPVSSL